MFRGELKFIGLLCSLCAIAGSVSAKAMAAPPIRKDLVRGCIGGDVALDGLDRNFLRAARQQEYPAYD